MNLALTAKLFSLPTRLHSRKNEGGIRAQRRRVCRRRATTGREHCFPRLPYPGDGGTTGITVEALRGEGKRTTLMEEVRKESVRNRGKSRVNRRTFTC